MIEPIAEMLRAYIEPLNFVERISGVVRPVKIVLRTDKDGKTIFKLVPMAINDFDDACELGSLIPMIPYSKYMSVHFFEDGGIDIVDQDSRYLHMEAHLRLVSWYNLNLININYTDCNLLTANVLAAIPYRLPNSGYYTVIRVEPNAEDVKGAAVFGAYTMDDKEKQYANYPFDCAAIRYVVKFWFPINCIESITINSGVC